MWVLYSKRNPFFFYSFPVDDWCTAVVGIVNRQSAAHHGQINC